MSVSTSCAGQIDACEGVKKGDDPCEPVSRFATGREARANVTLAIEKDGVSDQGKWPNISLNS